MTRSGGAPLVLAAGAYAGALAASAPAWPDDWDGVGFVESIEGFDMGRFRPHAPGYPVYVAMLRVAHVAARSPMGACVLVALASGVVAATFVWCAGRRLAGDRAAAAATALVAIAPASWKACSGVGSEAPALACAAACAWALVASRDGRRGAAESLGVGAGLGLGVRLSWTPLYVAALLLAPRAVRRRALLVGAGALAAWAIPFVAIVGPERLVNLYRAQWIGHASRWGGTAATVPGLARAVWFARDVVVDGLGAGRDALGLAIASLGVASFGFALRERRWIGPSGRRAAAVAVGPYAIWVALGQNVRDEPRHALPIVVALAAALGLAAGRSRPATAIAVALAGCMALRTVRDAYDRRTIPPPGVQLVASVRAEAGSDRPLVFGTRSVRFFETTELAARAFPAESFGDVEMALTRVNSPPSRVWITSEVEGLVAARRTFARVATLCRPPRIDRRRPCLDVYEWRVDER
ncbi:MAG TPA: glycosyltransferase family 39 protein [Polyangiaceae bacterium]|nr:glycosyltransferase family 39 protein [Polyangiaceae bacterium]